MGVAVFRYAEEANPQRHRRQSTFTASGASTPFTVMLELAPCFPGKFMKIREIPGPKGEI
jgi:hypothetical protein